MKKIPWCLYALIVGLIPLSTKVFIWCLLRDTKIVDAFKNPLDYVWSGLILQMATSYEILTTQEATRNKSPWRMPCVMISVFQIAGFVILYTSVAIQSVVSVKLYRSFLSDTTVLKFSWILWGVSVAFSILVYYKLTKPQEEAKA